MSAPARGSWPDKSPFHKNYEVNEYDAVRLVACVIKNERIPSLPPGEKVRMRGLAKQFLAALSIHFG
jgi:hypothetical protein